MALERSLNLLGQQRVDIPHLRAIESSIRADFDLLAGDLMAGGEAMVVRGFGVVTPIVGSAVSTLEVEVADSAIVHPLASVSGGIYRIPPDMPIEVMNPSANSNVEGSWTSGVTNYLGVDLRRESDLTTVDTVQFLDPPTNRETPKRVPLAKTLQHRFVISTVDFSNAPHVAPIAIVEVNVGGNVTAITDARQMMFRLGSGGANPDWLSSYSWPGGRDEVGESVFTGGDREIGSFKEMLDAVMTRLWEVGGGEHWYSPTADREVKVTNGPTVLGSGDNWEWTVGTSTLQWADVSIVFGNSPSSWRNTVTDGSAVIPDGSCLYVDLDRADTATLTAAVADLNTLGSPTIPGSRLVLAWRYGVNVYVRDRGTEVGRVATPVSLPVATTTTLGAVRINAAAGTPSSPVVPVLQAGGTVIVAASSGNSLAIGGVGFGTGEGVWGQGSAAGSIGTRGLGTVNNPGVFGEGHGTAAGVSGVGGATNGEGVIGTGTAAGLGGEFTGGATGSGVRGIAGGGDTHGVIGIGDGSGAGVLGTGGATGPGVKGSSTNSNAAVLGEVGGSTSLGAVMARITSTSNGSRAVVAMVNAAADGNDDGVFVASERIGEDDVDMVFGLIVDGTRTYHLQTDFSAEVLRPVTGGGAWSMGSSGYEFKNLHIGGSSSYIEMANATYTTSTQGLGNRIYQNNIPKAWGYLRINYSTDTVTVLDGTGITSASLEQDGDAPDRAHLQINWSGSFADTEYIPIVTAQLGYSMAGGSIHMLFFPHAANASAGGWPSSFDKSTSRCTFKAIGVSGTVNGFLDLKTDLTEDYYVHVLVFGDV